MPRLPTVPANARTHTSYSVPAVRLVTVPDVAVADKVSVLLSMGLFCASRQVLSLESSHL